ncbi:MAG: bacillithiol biosynthesis deacetylase BshB1 [Acidobacteria bacterium]|nr:bacillithiol biosynthesis deacetylase BshB1 [Acidobacteriota bacterium]MDA1235314.1 bacillithiol biosynthesis deacetylase BshB1 [Acidobacteriota bacterium]
MPSPDAAPSDLVVFAAHPDDAELCCGGLLLNTVRSGRTTAIVDLTRGELGSLGTPEQRTKEAASAAQALRLTHRVNLNIPDGYVRDTDDNRTAVVRAIRQLRPQLVIAPPLDDHHPDHMGTADLLRQSFYLCGIKNYLPALPPHRPRALLHHMSTRPMNPQVVVDISEFIQERMDAVRCYKSQFGVKQDKDFPVRIASEKLLESIEATLKYFGSLIGVAYGEPYTSELPIPATDLLSLFDIEPWKDH